MLLNDVSRYIKDKKLKGENIKIPKNTENLEKSSFLTVADEFKRKNARIVEGTVLQTKEVIIKTKNSGFAYFLDGIERKRLLFNYNFIPVTYGYVAAVIMKRTDKKMHSIGLEDFSEKLYLPYKEAIDSPDNYFDIEDFINYKIIPCNTGKKDEETGIYPQYPKEFEQKAHSDIQETRGKIERGLAIQWLNNGFDDGWLFVDGRLENKNNELKTSPCIVGVIKSHHVYYFNPQDQNKIFNLKKGERSSVFQPEKENIFSWYLRLYDSNTGGVDFGIIRIEIPADETLLNQVDEISSWILLERNPVAFPASRWDRMIYPIKYCEDYLKSKAPSYTKIESIA
jgi:hypothetical protein